MDLQVVECGVWAELRWIRVGQVMGTCECGNELSGYLKCREFLDYLQNSWLLKKESAA
jgi:hypothetical protein